MEFLDQIQKVTWHGGANECANLISRGFKHCFGGVGYDAPKELWYLKQVHSAQVVAAENFTSEVEVKDVEGDGIWCTTPNRVVGVQTADCLPLLLAVSQEKRKACMAIHAGWRGLASGILVEALRCIKDAGFEMDGVQVAIGPSIGLSKFEVGPEVVGAIKASCNGLTQCQLALCLIKGQGDRWHVDLQTAAILALINQQIKPENISIIRECTYLAEGSWHSYRREGAKCGRNYSWIQLPPDDGTSPGES